ncbi:MAG: hypothetical protein ACK4UN_10130 [Limisphaerales bacterium]
MKLLLILVVTLFMARTGIGGPIVFDEIVTPKRVFKEASVTSVTDSVATIFHAGGISKVPLAELPEEVRSRIAGLPAAATEQTPEEKAKAEELKKKLAQQRAALAEAAAWRGEPTEITVVMLKRSGSSIVFIMGEEQPREIRVDRMPSSVARFFEDIKTAEQQVAKAAEAHKLAQQALEDIPTIITGTREDIAVWEARVRRARNEVRKAEDKLNQATEARSELLRRQHELTSFIARKTAQTYTGLEIWEYQKPIHNIFSENR